MGLLRSLFMRRSAVTKPASEPRILCHGCSSDKVEMVVPASPEVLSYRCADCQRQWSVRAGARVRRS